MFSFSVVMQLTQVSIMHAGWVSKDMTVQEETFAQLGLSGFKPGTPRSAANEVKTLSQ